MRRKPRPKRVYKYRHFNGACLESLIEDELFFADPSTFNDPLDTQPNLEIDVDNQALERVLRILVERRVSTEMTVAARTMFSKGPQTSDHIARHARRKADEIIEELGYFAEQAEDETEDPTGALLGGYVEDELLKRYDRGIVSLAGRPDCPLMWSHYGDQHRGVCIGYSAPDGVVLQKVRYGGARTVKASLVAAMLDGDTVASARVDQAVLLKKAQAWRYEREWRLIGDRGMRDSPLELEEIVFGMRAPMTAPYIVAKALQGRERKVRLFEIRQQSGTFLLKKTPVDLDEDMARWPRRARSITEAFARFPIAEALELIGDRETSDERR